MDQQRKGNQVTDDHANIHIHNEKQSSKYSKTINNHQFYCPVCSCKMKDKSNLDRHLLTHSDDKPYKCSSCQFSTRHKYNLDRHYNVVHTKEKKFPCTICGYKAGAKVTLAKHLRGHDSTQIFTCSICSFTTNHKGNLVSHITTTHIADRPFQCPLCSYRGKTKSHLTKHSKCHNKKRDDEQQHHQGKSLVGHPQSWSYNNGNSLSQNQPSTTSRQLQQQHHHPPDPQPKKGRKKTATHQQQQQQQQQQNTIKIPEPSLASLKSHSSQRHHPDEEALKPIVPAAQLYEYFCSGGGGGPGSLDLNHHQRGRGPNTGGNDRQGQGGDCNNFAGFSSGPTNPLSIPYFYSYGAKPYS